MTDTNTSGYRHNGGRRLHITLTDRQYAALRDEAERSRVSMAEIARQCIDRVLRPHGRLRFAGLELQVTLARQVDAAVAARRFRLIRGGQVGASRVRLRDD